MKAMMLTGIRQIEMREMPTPEIIHDTDVLIRMKSVGVCGSDLHYFTTGRIGTQVVKFPFTLGHEGAGIVDKVGKSVKKIKPGDRVAIDPAMPCGQCSQCKAGRPHTCHNLKFLGCPGQANGCLSEYIVMPEHTCIKMADTLSFEEACISEPLAIGVYAVLQSIPMKNVSIGILGFGPIGMSIMLPAIAWGAGNVYVTDKINSRLQIAKQAGAAWAGNPDHEDVVGEIRQSEPLLLDAVFECCGKQEAMNQAVELVKPGGKIIIVGIPEFDNWSFNAHEIRRKEITIQNIRRQNNCTEKALEMIEKREINAGLFVTHRFSFHETHKAFKLVSNYEDGVMKAMINM